MAKEQKRTPNIRVKLTNLRLVGGHLFEPYQPTDAEKAKGHSARFKGMFFFSKDTPEGRKNHKIIQDAIDTAKEETWGRRAPDFMQDFLPLRDGDKWDRDEDDEEEDDREHFWEGHWYISAARSLKEKMPMGIFDRDRTPLKKEDNRPYNGCYVNVILEVWGLNEKGITPRVCAKIVGVQFHKHGDAFGGSKPVSGNDFDDVSGEDDGAGDFTDRDSRSSRDSRQSRDDREDAGSRARSDRREEVRRDRDDSRRDNVVDYKGRSSRREEPRDFEEEQPRRKAAASGGSRRPPVDEDDDI